MSGIYVNGMTMPKNCADCPICFYNGYDDVLWCGLAKCEVELEAPRRYSGCPLISVADHGDLIDADEFLSRAIGTKCFRGDYALMLQELVSESMTIIPADKKES